MTATANLENDTRAGVRNSGQTIEQVARGADIGMSWLQKFLRGDQDDYGVRKVQKVYDYLLQFRTTGNGRRKS